MKRLFHKYYVSNQAFIFSKIKQEENSHDSFGIG